MPRSKCDRVASNRTCPHGEDYQISFSGTEIRKLVTEGQAPPPQIMRAEVFEIVQKSDNPFVP